VQDQVRPELVRLWEAGEPRDRIADRLGITPVTVTRWVQAAGLPARAPGRRPGPEVRRVEVSVPAEVHAELVAVLADGESVQALLLEGARREVRRRARAGAPSRGRA
jgi:hypothetical protein